MAEFTRWAIHYRNTDIDGTQREGFCGTGVRRWEDRTPGDSPVPTLLLKTRREARAVVKELRTGVWRLGAPARQTIVTATKVTVSIQASA